MGSAKSISITAADGRLSEEEMATMIKEAERFAEEDKREANRIESRNRLETHLHRVSSALEENAELIADKRGLKIVWDTVDELMDWLGSNQRADAEELERKYEEIDALFRQLTEDLYQGQSSNDFGDDEL